MIESLEPRRVMSAIAAVDDNYQVQQSGVMTMGAPFVFDVLANDATDDGLLTIASAQSPDHGTVSIQHGTASMFAMLGLPGGTPDTLLFTPSSAASRRVSASCIICNALANRAAAPAVARPMPDSSTDLSSASVRRSSSISAASSAPCRAVR